MLEFIVYTLVFCMGSAVAMIIDAILSKSTHTSGVILVNTTDPNKDSYKLEIDDLQVLETADEIIFKIIRE